MCDQKILVKIKKMLELAERAGTVEEGQVALNKAQELMLKYSVSDSDLPASETEIIEAPLSETTKRTITSVLLFAVSLREHFPVEVSINRAKLMIIGRRIDVENFKGIMQAINKQFDKHHHTAYSDYLKTDPIPEHVSARAWRANFRKSYSTGFAAGLNKAFTINEKERGLIVVTPKDVLEQHQALTKNGKAKSVAGHRGAGYAKGMADGKNVGSVVKANEP